MLVRTLRHYPLTTLGSAIIIVLCLIWVPPHPDALDRVSLIDKWTHIVLFALLCLTWCYERRRRHTPLRRLLWALTGTSAFGALIEVSQGTLTATRSADTADWLADTLGALLGLIVGRYVLTPLWRRKHKR